MTSRVPDDSEAQRAALARRSEGFARFAAWEAGHQRHPAPAEAVSAAAWLYERLPAASRTRPIDTAGVQILHRLLSRLSRRI